ncbi:MAG: mechanosensitive ion channel [Ignavibacteriales bacterium]|nr:mechanosensitive ion channel [Ignavibacteriales bacterium]
MTLPIKTSLLHLFLVVLQQFKVTMGSGTSLERMFLTVIIILSLIMFNYIKLDKGIKKGTNQYTPIVIKTINLLTILFALAFIADVFGYVMLSLTIVDGVLSSLFGLSTLYILAQMIEGILLVLLQTDFAKRSNIIRDHSELVKQKIHKIIKILFYILAVSSVLRSFGLLIILGNFLEELFGNNITVGTFSLNIGTVVLFFFSIWFAVTIARSIRFILETDILVRMNLKRGVAGAVSSMTLYAITGFGIVFAIMSSGLDLNSFSLLAGALGVGIGFGLQDIVRNFISGIILIFERPVQIGDAVEVEELSGVIRKIGIRSR